ncbi:TQXA domain-containing protein [Spinactinospora alkalitolerans]|uniref:TQXA domain-containing protein n=1 Tax=Spinactinospora alkalitolerans TaxID=687207 RepID=A0A852TPH8_9ACTN|nr:Cys-Gln thioester bond-forming surface protein [Spinactinospora alkalitolerans]NYE45858.1 TQXA domain-containing protein [Spinactinospora alkalitolerans]
MIKTSPSPKGRLRALSTIGATSTAALLAFGMTAAPAMADDETYDGGAEGSYTGNVEDGYQLGFRGGGFIGTSLFELTLKDGSTLPAYCIDFETDIVPEADYAEGDWSEYPGEGEFADSEPGKVLWILQNAYPTLSADELGAAARVEDLDAHEALSATQAAIWHYSNGVRFNGQVKEYDEEKEKYVNADPQTMRDIDEAYKHLVKKATEVESNPASLTISPQEASGEAGENIGEFAVETSVDSVPLALDGPDGVKLVDAEGNEISEVGNGGTFSVQVPGDAAAGEATVSGSVTATVQLGRLFKGVHPEKPTQTLITAGEGETEASAQARATWTEGVPEESPSPSPSPSDTPSPSPSDTPAPTPSETPDDKPTPPADKPEDEGGLPVTGAALGGLVAAAVVAIGGGGAAMYLSRKRKSGNIAE